ncbi:MAG: hypothetical protein JSR00_01430 [Bacteroidetes bacterium]|nr:hypothetical protein [Bacteroidota bacterium]
MKLYSSTNEAIGCIQHQVWQNGGGRKPCFSSCNSIVLHIGLDVKN